MPAVELGVGPSVTVTLCRHLTFLHRSRNDVLASTSERASNSTSSKRERLDIETMFEFQAEQNYDGSVW